MPRTCSSSGRGDGGGEAESFGEPAEPWEYTLYIPHDLRAVTIGRRTRAA
ncbi:hypothetical protein AB0O76_19315 [Streptomyces sp. NPDC086554]